MYARTHSVRQTIDKYHLLEKIFTKKRAFQNRAFVLVINNMETEPLSLSCQFASFIAYSLHFVLLRFNHHSILNLGIFLLFFYAEAQRCKLPSAFISYRELNDAFGSSTTKDINAAESNTQRAHTYTAHMC